MKIKEVTINGFEHKLICNNFEDNNNYYTVLVGKNSAGKTECLIQVIGCLLRLQLKKNNSPYIDPLDEILEHEFKRYQESYEFETKLTFSESTNSKLEEMVKFKKSNSARIIKKFDGSEVTLNDGYFRHSLNTYPLLNKEIYLNIIAISESPYSKFPILNSEYKGSYSLFSPQLLKNKDTATVYADDYVLPQTQRLVKSIFHSIACKTKVNLRALFELLKFELKIKVSIDLKDRYAKHSEIGVLKSIDVKVVQKQAEGVLFEKTPAQLRKYWEYLSERFDLSSLLGKSYTESHSSTSILLDIIGDYEGFEALNFLIEYEVLSVNKIAFNNSHSEDYVDSTRLSSGQYCLLTLFFSIASKISNGALILLDEPEISLHPYWQAQIIPLLNSTFSNYKNCHFILATHSPHIISNLSNINSSVVIFDSNDKSSHTVEGGKISSQSVDFQLAEVFEYPGFRNEYVNRELISYLVQVSKGREINDETYKTIRRIVELESKLDSSDPMLELIYAVKKTLKANLNEGC